MNTITEKQWHKYFMQLTEIEKKSIVSMLRAFLKERNEGEHPVSIEEYNKEIDAALAEVESGSFVTQENMEKIASQW